MRKYYKIISIVLLLCVCTMLYPVYNTEAASGIKIYNSTTGKTTNYTGQQLSYILNGADVPMALIPGIIENGNALASYKDIFEDYYKIACRFNKDTGKITLKHNGTTISMTLGSKKAYVNGVAKTLGAAPVKVKYISSNQERILVPTRFVADALNINYNYESPAARVTMYKKTPIVYDDSSLLYTGTFGRIIYDGTISTNYKLPVLQLDGAVMVSLNGLIKNDMKMNTSYNASTGEIVLSKGDIYVNMTIGSTTAYINDTMVNCVTAPFEAKFTEYGSETVLLPVYFISKAFNYEYRWDRKSSTCYIDTIADTGIWKESILNNRLSESDTINNISTSSLENLFNSNPVETYFELTGADISPEYINAIENINTKSINIPYSSNSTADLSDITMLEDTLPDTVTYSFEFSEPIYKIDNLGFDENDQLILFIPNAICNTDLNLQNSELLSNASINTVDNGIEINLLMESKQLVYDIKLSKDYKHLLVTLYKNHITDVSFGRNNEGIEYIKLNTLFPINTEIVNNNNTIILRMHNMINSYGNIVDYPESETINQIRTVKNIENTIIASFKKNKGKDIIYTETGENTLTLYLADADTTTEFNMLPEWNIINNLDIKLPKGIVFDEITTEDRYTERKIVITLPGKHKEFYETYPIVNSYEVITNVEVREGIKNTTDIILSTSVVRGFELIENNDSIELKIGNPKEFYEKIIVLDAGHGGYDPGAVKGSVKEKDINYTILNKYTAEYFEKSDIKVYFTRLDDILINLYERAAYSTEVAADFFISLHMNANNSSSANGTGVYYSTLNTCSTNGLTSHMIADLFADNLSSAIKTKNNGKLKGDYVVIKESRVPAVLIELAFMTNSSDLKKLTSKSVQKTAAKTIYETILSLYN